MHSVLYIHSSVTYISIYAHVHLLDAYKHANEDANIPTHSHHTDEEYNWCIKKSKFYYNHLPEEIIISPVSENYWINFTRLRITHEDLHKSYVSIVKHIKDKK